MSNGGFSTLQAVVAVCSVWLVVVPVVIVGGRALLRRLQPGGSLGRLADGMAERRWPGWGERHGMTEVDDERIVQAVGSLAHSRDSGTD
jgi:hypothetical protein